MKKAEDRRRAENRCVCPSSAPSLCGGSSDVCGGDCFLRIWGCCGPYSFVGGRFDDSSGNGFGAMAVV